MTIQKEISELIENGLLGIELPESPRSLYGPFRYSLGNGGKRIRPLLTLLSAGLNEGTFEDALPAALAIEVLHNFTLVHDDIMDEAEIRRGEPSVYKKWDESTAILVGDVMFGKSYELLDYYAQNDAYSKAEYVAIHRSFQKAVTTVCEGQAYDMEFMTSSSVTLNEYISMIEGKTAALLSSALEMGAISAHASSDRVQSLSKLGNEMGIAFQIQDDLLDAIADPEKFGKRPGGDIYEGKKTYLSICALQRANEEQRLFISDILDKRMVTEREVEEVLQLFHDLDVIKDTSEEVTKHYDQALASLSLFPDSAYKHELEHLLIFLRQRDH